MNQKPEHSNRKPRHWLWMTICCLVVILAIIILPRYFNLGTLGIIFLLLLCAASHYFLMRKMHKKEKDDNSRFA